VSNYGKVLGGIQAPTTVQNQTQLSPVNQVAGLATLLGGTSGTSGLLGQLGVTGGLSGLFSSIGNLFNSPTDTSSAVSTTPDNSYNQPVQTVDPNAPGYLDPNLNQQYPQGSM